MAGAPCGVAPARRDRPVGRRGLVRGAGPPPRPDPERRAARPSGPARRIGGHRPRTRRRGTGRRDGSRSPRGWPSSSPPTPASAQASSSTGMPAATPTARARPLPGRPGVAARALAPAARRDRHPPPRPSGSRPRAPRSPPTATSWTCRAGSRCSGRAGCRPTTSGSWRALGTGREVHLWLSDASPTLWQALADEPVTIPRRRDGPVRRRGATPPAPVPGPGLPRSCGCAWPRPPDRRGHRTRTPPRAPQRPPSWASCSARSTANVDPWAQRAAHGAFRMPADDRSIQVHSCHGQPRQADVVREVVLGLLQADPTLEPRDILIMCPDLDAFAPLLSAAFSELPDGAALPASAWEPRCAPDRRRASDALRLRIADRTPEQSNEVLAALAAVLAMVPGRMPLSEVLDLAAHAPVRTRFGFDDEDLARLGSPHDPGGHPLGARRRQPGGVRAAAGDRHLGLGPGPAAAGCLDVRGGPSPGRRRPSGRRRAGRRRGPRGPAGRAGHAAAWPARRDDRRAPADPLGRRS